MNSTQEIYDKLRECFISSGSNCTDKAKRFRSIYEEFARRENVDFDASNIGLGERLSQIFHVRGADYKVTEKSKTLLWKLNDVVHKDSNVTPEELTEYYQALLVIVRAITHVEPDEKSLVLSGLQTEWYTMGLNAEQKSAVIDDARVINVNAGPGTGKTHLLVHKMLYYLKDNPRRHLVALTFTNTAAAQLKERFIEILEKAGKRAEEYTNCRTATIHSYCYQCLAEYYKSVGRVFNYEILDESDLDSVAEDIAASIGQFDAKSRIVEILANGGMGELAEIVEEYKRRNNFIRVEDILRLFEEESQNEAFLHWLGQRIDCLLIDESQDLSKSIYRVIGIFLSVNPNMRLFFVGDPRQNIFGFNGGSYRHLQTFVRGKKVSEHTLTLTYRCPQAVINKVNPLTFSDCENPQLVLINTSLTGVCNIIPCATRKAEAKSVAEIVKKLKDFSQTCVMATGLWYLEDTARVLNEYHIPFVVKGGRRFLSRSIKIVNYCLRVAATYDKHSIQRLTSYVYGFKESPLHAALKHYYEEGKGLAQNVLQDVLVKVKVLLAEGNCLTDNDMALVEQYVELASEYNTIPDLLFACSSGKNDKFSPFYERDFKVECITPTADGAAPLVLTTIHAAKGLEWNNVILAGVADRVLPSWRCYEQGITMAESEIRLDEEKKKYYVAVTRCKQNLFLTYSMTSENQWGKIFQCVKSPFIVDGVNFVTKDSQRPRSFRDWVYERYGQE